MTGWMACCRWASICMTARAVTALRAGSGPLPGTARPPGEQGARHRLSEPALLIRDDRVAHARARRGQAEPISSRDTLVALLLSSYPALRRRLASRLGSIERANDALQDTYVKLRRLDELGEVRNPQSYLFRMAVNIARNRERDEARLLSATDIQTLVDLADEAPDPHRAVESRLRLEAVGHALQQLPERRRKIFRRAWIDGASHETISGEFGLAVRTVRHELQVATEALHDATKERSIADLQFRLRQVSH